MAYRLKQPTVLDGGDVDEDQGALVVGYKVDPGSLGGAPTGLDDLVVLTLDEAAGCPNCLILKFEIAYGDPRSIMAGPLSRFAVRDPHKLWSRAGRQAKTQENPRVVRRNSRLA